MTAQVGAGLGAQPLQVFLPSLSLEADLSGVMILSVAEKFHLE